MTKQQRLDGILDSLVEGDFFIIKEVLKSKSFCMCFRLASKLMSSSGKDNGKDIPAEGQLQSQATRVSPIIPKMILAVVIILKMTHYVKNDRYTEAFPNGKMKGSKRSTLAAKVMVISEKHSQDEVSDILPTKKVKYMANSKGNGTTSPPEAKKKSNATPTKTASKGARPTVALGKGTSAIPSDVLGLITSMLNNPAMAKKLLKGVIPPGITDSVHRVGQTWQGIEGEGDDWAIEKLKKMKEDRNVTVERLEK
ncbi:hypothetical protein Acr_17g0006180 [Actinidia rufa]|uniref:Uncharacterized protein n=1 Tax=Actinidia rufa TaxID=165716 RepID=A0A7J0G2N6_9ERIC|nr:hypothetical protein Acr_17g0006180 [Actinidia rufa]